MGGLESKRGKPPYGFSLRYKDAYHPLTDNHLAFANVVRGMNTDYKTAAIDLLERDAFANVSWDLCSIIYSLNRLLSMYDDHVRKSSPTIMREFVIKKRSRAEKAEAEFLVIRAQF